MQFIFTKLCFLFLQKRHLAEVQKKLKEEKSAMKPHTMAVRKQHNALFRRYLDFEIFKNLFSGELPTKYYKRQSATLSTTEAKIEICHRRSKSVDLDQVMSNSSVMTDAYESVPAADLSTLSSEISRPKALSEPYESVPPCSISLNNGVVEVKVESDQMKPADTLYEVAPATALSLRVGSLRPSDPLDTYESVPDVSFELSMLSREVDEGSDSSGSTPPSSLDQDILRRVPSEESSGLSSSQSCVSLSKQENGGNRRMHKSVSLSSEVHDRHAHASAMVTHLVRQYESNQLRESRPERPRSTYSTDSSLSPITPEHAKLMKTHSVDARNPLSRQAPKSLSFESSGNAGLSPKSLSFDDSGRYTGTHTPVSTTSFSPKSSLESGCFTATHTPVSTTPLSPKSSLDATYENISGYQLVPAFQGKLRPLSTAANQPAC